MPLFSVSFYSIVLERKGDKYCRCGTCVGWLHLEDGFKMACRLKNWMRGVLICDRSKSIGGIAQFPPARLEPMPRA